MLAARPGVEAKRIPLCGRLTHLLGEAGERRDPMNGPDRGGYRLRDSVAHALGRIASLQTAEHLSPGRREVSRESVIIRHGQPRLDCVNSFSIHARLQM